MQLRMSSPIARDDAADSSAPWFAPRENPGTPSRFSGPECHGARRSPEGGGGLRSRGQTGLADAADVRLEELIESVEDALRDSARALEESWLVMPQMASRARDAAPSLAFEREAAAVRPRADLVRQVVMGDGVATDAVGEFVCRPGRRSSPSALGSAAGSC